jgi:cell filamentation protein
MTGKFVDGPANADVWKNREADWKAEGVPKGFFRERAAHYLGEINALHPFREGNTRAQREFIRELAVEAGYEIACGSLQPSELSSVTF